jgi:hypothetical protein
MSIKPVLTIEELRKIRQNKTKLERNRYSNIDNNSRNALPYDEDLILKFNFDSKFIEKGQKIPWMHAECVASTTRLYYLLDTVKNITSNSLYPIVYEQKCIYCKEPFHASWMIYSKTN